MERDRVRELGTGRVSKLGTEEGENRRQHGMKELMRKRKEGRRLEEEWKDIERWCKHEKEERKGRRERKERRELETDRGSQLWADKV